MLDQFSGNGSIARLFQFIAGIHVKSRRLFESQIRGIGLTYPQYGLLLAINGGSGVSQIGLAEKLETDRTSIMVICDSLEKKGYIQRNKNPKDRRENLIVMTDEGMVPFKEAQKIMNDHIAKIDTWIDQQEIFNCTAVLEKIYTRLKEEES